MATLLDALCAAAPVGAIAVEDAESVEMMFQKAAAAADEAASQLMIVLDYDLTISKATTAECHHMLRDASALPAGFRDDVNTLFAARDPTHARHTEIYGMESDADRPHRFWLHYNHLLVKHCVTQRMIDEAVAGRRRDTALCYATAWRTCWRCATQRGFWSSFSLPALSR